MSPAMKTILVIAACVVVLVATIAYWLKNRPSERQGEPQQIGPQTTTRNKSTTNPSPSTNPLMGMREQLLRGRAPDFGIDATSEPNRTWGCLMEMGIDDASVTILSLLDGTTSMYISTGGGVIGAGEHEPVRQVAKAFIAQAGRDLGKMTRADQFPSPKNGRVRFYVLTESCVFTIEEDADTLGEGKHTLSPLFYAGQNVLTQVRLITQKQQK